MTGKVRASLHRLAENAGPIAVLGMFLLLAVVVYQQTTIVGLQKSQAESSKNGRATLTQIAEIAAQIKSFTDPNSAITRQQKAQTAGYLTSLAAANQASINDQTRKIGEMFTACRTLPCAATTIERILAEPVPVPTFAGAAVTPAPAAAPATVPSIAPTVKIATPAPTPTPTLTPFLVVQCPIICPRTK